MSNTRQFLLPLNYDITKEIYPKEEDVQKKEYLIDELKSSKQHHQLNTNTFAGETNFSLGSYADKLRHRAKFR